MPTTPKESGALPPLNREWLAEFEAAARRPLRQRFKTAFIKTYKPFLDDADCGLSLFQDDGRVSKLVRNEFAGMVEIWAWVRTVSFAPLYWLSSHLNFRHSERA